ncbi:MAG: hypothetical protein A2007_05425 [Verrucomicrobia bacterium GWC2_42_7]|nr:MAG: hypothetical protein A2007_05425 [Verrucomicrobia bacterium GWC2_42_7]
MKNFGGDGHAQSRRFSINLTIPPSCAKEKFEKFYFLALPPFRKGAWEKPILGDYGFSAVFRGL